MLCTRELLLARAYRLGRITVQPRLCKIMQYDCETAVYIISFPVLQVEQRLRLDCTGPLSVYPTRIGPDLKKIGPGS